LQALARTGAGFERADREALAVRAFDVFVVEAATGLQGLTVLEDLRAG